MGRMIIDIIVNANVFLRSGSSLLTYASLFFYNRFTATPIFMSLSRLNNTQHIVARTDYLYVQWKTFNHQIKIELTMTLIMD